MNTEAAALRVKAQSAERRVAGPRDSLIGRNDTIPDLRAERQLDAPHHAEASITIAGRPAISSPPAKCTVSPARLSSVATTLGSTVSNW